MRDNRSARRPGKRLWRWRSNPLRRREDVVEAWIVLVVWVLVVVGGTVAGTVTARAAGEEFARQRTDRRPVEAVLLADVPKSPEAGSGSDRALGKVRWTVPDGTTRTGRTLVAAGLRSGAVVEVWLDGRGSLTTEPPGRTEAALEAGLFGAASALSLAGLTYGSATLARRRLDRRRYDQWGAEWELVGPRWGHKTR